MYLLPVFVSVFVSICSSADVKFFLFFHTKCTITMTLSLACCDIPKYDPEAQK